MLDEFDFSSLTLDQHGSLAIITLGREASEALSTQTLAELSDALDLLQQEAEISALILTGEKGFAGSAAPKDLAQLSHVYAAREFALAGQDITHQLSQFSCPVIAAIDGMAYGAGLELALACDLRIASENARFCMPEVRFGMIPAFGGTQRLSRLIGSSRALDLLLTAREIDAQEAKQIGLVNYLAAQPLQKARELAEMTQHAPIALSLIKEAVRRGMEGSLEAGLEIEADLFAMVSMSQDFSEGQAARLARRTAQFKGE